MNVNRLCTPALTAVLWLWPVHGGAQSAAAPATPQNTLQISTQLVVLDVVVTDKQGQPATGLSKADFQVFEDNSQRPIRSFEPPSEHRLPSATVASPDTLFDPAHPAGFGSSPVTVLVLDQLNTHFADSSYARNAVLAYLNAQPAVLPQPTTLLTVYDAHFKQLQGFTRNRGALLAALKAAPTEYPFRLETDHSSGYGPVERLDASLHALEDIAEADAGIPGRKNLIWVGGGFPTIDPEQLEDVDRKVVRDTLQHVTDLLLSARVTVSAIDPTTTAAGMTEIIDESQQEFALAAGDSLAHNADPFDTNEDFDRLGPITGGRIVRARNDVAAQIRMAVSAGQEYYTLGYQPAPTGPKAPPYRRIRVVCLRPDLTVTTRNGYYTDAGDAGRTPDTVSYDLTTAAQSTVPLNGLRVHAERAANGSNAAAPTWDVSVGVNGLTWQSQADGTSKASVQVMAVSLGLHGKVLAHTLHGMTVNAKATANLHDPNAMATLAFAAAPANKTGILRFVVRDAATGRMGTFDLSLAP